MCFARFQWLCDLTMTDQACEKISVKTFKCRQHTPVRTFARKQTRKPNMADKCHSCPQTKAICVYCDNAFIGNICILQL